MNHPDAYVKTSIQEQIGTITFHHPQGNSLPAAVLQNLARAIDLAGKDPGIKVIILKSAGEKAFCAGACFEELIAINDAESGKRFFSGFAHVINAMRKCPKLIIGRVQGKCVGGGVGLASATDYCLATETADVKLSELAVGIGPFVVGPVVEKKIGGAAFSQLAIDAGNWRSATWAKSHGLFADTFGTIVELDKAVDALAANLSRSNPEAMLELKKIFWLGTDDWDELLLSRASISGKLVTSDFTRTAIATFKNKG